MVPAQACDLETTESVTPKCGMKQASVTAQHTPIIAMGLMRFGGEYYVKASVPCPLIQDMSDEIT